MVTAGDLKQGLQYLLGLTGGLYALGFLVSSLFLASLGVHTGELLRPIYVEVGVTYLIFLAPLALVFTYCVNILKPKPRRDTTSWRPAVRWGCLIGALGAPPVSALVLYGMKLLQGWRGDPFYLFEFWFGSAFGTAYGPPSWLVAALLLVLGGLLWFSSGRRTWRLAGRFGLLAEVGSALVWPGLFVASVAVWLSALRFVARRPIDPVWWTKTESALLLTVLDAWLFWWVLLFPVGCVWIARRLFYRSGRRSWWLELNFALQASVVAVCLVPPTILFYAATVYPLIAPEYGGGAFSPVSVVFTDHHLQRRLGLGRQNPGVYLVDRTSSTVILAKVPPHPPMRVLEVPADEVKAICYRRLPTPVASLPLAKKGNFVPGTPGTVRSTVGASAC